MICLKLNKMLFKTAKYYYINCLFKPFLYVYNNVGNIEKINFVNTSY